MKRLSIDEHRAVAANTDMESPDLDDLRRRAAAFGLVIQCTPSEPPTRRTFGLPVYVLCGRAFGKNKQFGHDAYSTSSIVPLIQAIEALESERNGFEDLSQDD